MADYTTNLKLTKPALNSTGWGTVVNSGVTDLVDVAVSGVETVDVTAGNVTMTIDSGASGTNDARNMFIEVDGTLPANRVVTVPVNSKLYFVFNNTTGAYTLDFENAGGGVEVPQGKRVPLYSDGTEVLYAFDHLGALTLGTALAATSGGTGQSSYAVGDLLYADTTTTLAKLASVAEGSVLRAKGVGTAPAWEQVDLTTDVTGVLPAANGGTGLSAPGALNNVLSSDGAGAWTSTALSTLVPDASDTTKGVVELATDAEVQTGTDTTRAITPAGLRGGALVFGTVQTPTSGTTVDFTSIPSWVKRITVVFREFVLSSSSGTLHIRLGTGGVVETTDYYGAISYVNSGGGAGAGLWSTSETMRIAFGDGASGVSFNGSAILTRLSASSNVWAVQSLITDRVGELLVMSAAGTKELAGTLDTLQILVITGTFLSGSVNIMYE